MPRPAARPRRRRSARMVAHRAAGCRMPSATLLADRSRLARAVGAARRLDRLRGLLPAASGGARAPRRRRQRAALAATSCATRCCDSVGAVDGFAADRRRVVVGARCACATAACWRAIAGVRPAERRSRSTSRARGGGTAGGCRGRGARGIALRRPHPHLDRRSGRRALPARAGRRPRSSRSSAWARPAPAS